MCLSSDVRVTFKSKLCPPARVSVVDIKDHTCKFDIKRGGEAHRES